MDSQGVRRGACQSCSCSAYVRPSSGNNCTSCNHKPINHQSIGSSVQSISISSSAVQTCIFPNCTKPCYADPTTGIPFDFCGKTHGQAYKAASIPAQHVRSTASSGPVCRFPNCGRPCFVDGATIHDYCGKTHAEQHKTTLVSSGICTKCKRNPSVDSARGKNFCQTCFLSQIGGAVSPPVSQGGVYIVALPQHDLKYTSVKDQFTKKWLKSKYTPYVLEIYMVNVGKAVEQAYGSYQAALEARGSFSTQYKPNGDRMSAGNECRRFHGTARLCSIGLNSNTQLCTQNGCNVCSIIKNGFLINKAGSNFGWGRFGRGIYCTATSSKSHDYNLDSEKTVGGHKTRVMFMTKMCVGKGYKTKEDMRNLTQCPPGHDSVLGEIGSSLNYDECVAYNEAAVKVAYLITYRYVKTS